MAYTLKELSSPELASMYTEYLRLSDKLANGQIEQLEALRRVEQLQVTDNYDAKWKVDPNTGTFVMIDANGVRTTDADPRAFQPADPHAAAEVGIIPEYEFTPAVSENPISFKREKMVWWKKGLFGLGAVVVLFVVFFAGFVTHNQVTPEPSDTPTKVARPTVDGDGPSAERTRQVMTQLSSGESDRVKYVVPGETNVDMLRWATAVFGSLNEQGYRLQEMRTEGGVSVLQVLDGNDQVVMQGDLKWSQDAGGNWVLDEVPLMAPVDSSVEVSGVETPAPDSTEPSDGGGEESGSPEPEPSDGG